MKLVVVTSEIVVDERCRIAGFEVGECGDSVLPPGPVSGGSAVTASVIPAVLDAVRSAIKLLQSRAAAADGSPFKGAATALSG